VTPLAVSLQRTVAHLEPHRQDLLDAWVRALSEAADDTAPDIRTFCARTIDGLLGRLSQGELEALLHLEAEEAAAAARRGASFHTLVLAIRVLDRCCLPFLRRACADAESLAECLLALDELGDRRLEILIRAQEEEAARRLHEAEEQASQAADRARELARLNEALRRSEAQSQHRAEQIGMLASVAHRLAGVLDPERLMQEAADLIQARMNHTFVAVVVLDDEGVLVGRWAGRQGVGRRSAGRTQGPAGGVIGRALRKRAPQVVADVAQDGDYHPDVPGTRSEMVIPLLEDGAAVGAMDFQSEKPAAFGLDDVAVGETIAEFLVVALRNARLFDERRRA
jgi:L-methionine (R)-S-oxide reductase